MKKFNSLVLLLLTTVFINVFATSTQVPMFGNYQVGVGQIYTTLGAAVTDINTLGLSGPVLLEVTSDITELAAIQLNVASNSNMIMIKPAAGVSPTITLVGDASNTIGDLAHVGFGINATSNLIIDGSNTVGGTTKDMTFALNDETNGYIIMVLYQNCDNITVKNLNMVFAGTMYSGVETRGIYLDGQATGVADNFTIENCTVGGISNIPYYGLSMTGSSLPLNITGLTIKDNLIYGKQRAMYLSRIGDTSLPTNILGNTSFVYGGENSGNTTYMIYYANLAGTVNLTNNKFPVMTTASAAGTSGVYGIGSATTGTQTMNIVNNFIGGDCQSSGVAVPAEFDLISIKDPGVYNIYNNTFYLPSITNATKVNNILINKSTAVVNMANNIIINESNSAIATCINKTAGILTSDYNVLYTGTSSNIGVVVAATKATLADWQAAGFDANSKSVTVNFTDVTTGDLTLTGASVQDNNLSVPRLATILTDMIGTARSNPTYAGAQESTLPFKMKGIYSVGAGQTYNTLGTAVADINSKGMSGAVTLQITSDITETSAIQLSVPNNTNMITIKPATGVSPTVTLVGDATNAIGDLAHVGFGINATSNLIIDGSNTVGGTTKDMTFALNDATNGYVILNMYQNCDDVTIKNLNMVFAGTMYSGTETRGIYLDGQATGVSDNFTLSNCNIGDQTNTPYYGLSLTGSSLPLYITGMTVSNNNAFGRMRAAYLSRIGDNVIPTTISGNTLNIYGGENSGALTQSLYYINLKGIINIENNRFPVITSASAAGNANVYAICSSASGLATITISNNFIGGDCQITGASVPTILSLMYIVDNNTYYIYNNTLYLASITNATKTAGILFNNASNNATLKNNIIINQTSSTNAFGIVKIAGTLTSDNNVIYTGASSNIGQVVSTNKVTLADWQAAGFDANSKNVAVNFTNATTGNLTLTGASIQDNNLSVPRLATVLTDIIGTYRSNPTYVGAQESTLPFVITKIDSKIETLNKILINSLGIQVQLDKESIVELYSANGVLLDKVKTVGNYARNLSSGIYIMNINGKATKFIK